MMQLIRSHLLFVLRDLSKAYYTRGGICKFKVMLYNLDGKMMQVIICFMTVT